MIEKSTVLIVDDTQQNVQVLSQMLRNEDFQVLAAFNGPDALKLVDKRKPDLILLDVMMPGMNGYEVCEQLKQSPQFSQIPVIFLSALDDAEAKIRAFDAGGIDYITKPFQQKEVLARIRLHLKMRLLELQQERNIAELQEKQEHLSRLNKDKDEVLAIVSHDMRNPLGGIIGISNMMRSERIEDPEQVDEMLRLIESSAERLLLLVNDLLDVAVIEANSIKLDFRDIDLAEMLQDVRQTHEPTARTKSIDLELDVPQDLPHIRADASKIAQVISNLVSNAIKFTPSSGKIIMKSWTIESDPEHIMISITDNGIGIPEEYIPGLFQKIGKHQRTGTYGEKGTGLGMPIVKRFVEVHQGILTVKSEENKGTVFTITLPINPKSDE